MASLPGSVFGRPAAEPTLRLSYVNFDGEQALAAAEAGEMVDETFIQRHCPDTIEAVHRMAEWAGVWNSTEERVSGQRSRAF